MMKTALPPPSDKGLRKLGVRKLRGRDIHDTQHTTTLGRDLLPEGVVSVTPFNANGGFSSPPFAASFFFFPFQYYSYFLL